MRSMILNKIHKAGIFVSTVLILAMPGCINDDLSTCGINVNYVFTKNVDGIDKFATNVDKINLFVYDSNGNFIREYSEEGAPLHSGPMKLNLMAGTYSLVAWGNLSDDFELTNTSTLADAMLSLKRSATDTVSTYPAHLYHGGLYQLKVDPVANPNQSFTIELTKNTNNINVTTTVDDASAASTRTFNCSIISRNGDYKFDNSITGSDRLYYIQDSHIDNNGGTVSNFITMRELNDNSTASTIRISSTGKSGGPVTTILEEDLVPMLIPISITGNLDIDDTYDITIEISVTNTTTTITINDVWEYNIAGGII